MSNKNSNGFIGWIKNYPVKAVILLFLVVLPVIALTSFTIVKFNQSSRFYFESKDGKPVYLNNKDLTSEKELNNYLDLNIELIEIITPLETVKDDQTTYSKGKYTFDVSYEKKTSTPASFSFRWMLDTKWVDTRTTPETLSISDKVTSKSINYNHKLPIKKNLFIKVNRPNLFVEIKMVTNESDPILREEKTFYVKVDLSKFKPTVIPAS